MKSHQRTFTDRVREIRRLMTNKYISLSTKDGRKGMSDEALAMEPTDSLAMIVDDRIRDFNSKVRRCNTCRYLRDSEASKKYGYVNAPLWQCCDKYINPCWKGPLRKRREVYYRRPHNKACPAYEYDDNNYINRKRNGI